MTTVEQLIDDINNSKINEYSFIRILDKTDRAKFIAKIPEKYYNDIYLKKQIQFNLWINILDSINPNIDYIIYRKSYEGETKGKTFVGQPFSYNRVVILLSIHSYKKPNNFIDNIVNAFSFNNKTKKKHILLFDNKISEIYFDKYILSSWYNNNYSLELYNNIKDKWI